MKKQIIILTLALIAVLVSVSAVSAVDRVVGSEPGEYSDIQSAVNAANDDGDTIIIQETTLEQVTLKYLLTKTSILLVKARLEPYSMVKTMITSSIYIPAIL
ncbi:hypothetical protein [Methanobacterium oryzae]|uniref:hypothetical protein n=1 Tax=Methanobacterium oryzae TaxID=69540 RepID=UPI003D22E006